MKRLDDFKASNSTGGAPFYNEDFYNIVQEVYDAINPTIQGLGKQITTDGNFVVSGLTVTPNASNWDISAGIVSLGGELYRYDGDTNITSGTKYIAIATDVVTSRNFKNGGSKPFYREKKAELLSSTSGGEEISFDPSDSVPFVLLDQFRINQATETLQGTAEIATQAETDAGTDDTKIVTPSKIANATAIIDSQQLVNGSVDNVHLAGLIDGGKLANSTLPSSKVDNSGSTGIAIYTINGFAGVGAPPLGPSGYRGFIWINPTGGTVWTSDNSTWYRLA